LATRREHNNRAWLAWHIAALSRAKKLPALKSLYTRDKPRVQTWQEQFAVMETFAVGRNRALQIREQIEWPKAR